MTDLLTVKGPEVRTFGAAQFRTELRADTGSRFLEGRAVPYGEFSDIGWFMEQHQHGAYTKTIRENPHLPLLLFHDARKFPVGKVERWKDGEGGLDAVWRMDSADDAQEAARLADEGFMTGLSVGFVPIQRTFEDREGKDWITVTEARLLEVSLTPTPAYAGAQVQLVRSAGAITDRADEPEAAKRRPGR